MSRTLSLTRVNFIPPPEPGFLPASVKIFAAIALTAFAAITYSVPKFDSKAPVIAQKKITVAKTPISTSVEKPIQLPTITLLSDQFFKRSTAVLSSKGEPALDKVIDQMESAKGVRRLEIAAFTDDTPVILQKALYSSNLELSQARALRVRDAFEKAGFSPDQLKAVGFGDAHPAMPNRTADGKIIAPNLPKNRRIVIRLLPSEEDNQPL